MSSEHVEVLRVLRERAAEWGHENENLSALDAAIAALSAPQPAAEGVQPEARGVVDEGSRSVTRQLLHWGGVPVHVTGTVTTSPGNWSLIDAALAAQPGGSDNG